MNGMGAVLLQCAGSPALWWDRSERRSAGSRRLMAVEFGVAFAKLLWSRIAAGFVAPAFRWLFAVEFALG